MIYLLLAPQSTDRPGQALAFKQLEFGSSFHINSGEPIPRIDKIEVFAATSQPDLGTDRDIGVLSQKAALDAVHALLSTQPLLWNEEQLGPLWVDFYLDGDINTEIRGDSGGLAYSLRLLEELTRYDADGSQRFADTHNALSECVIGATGTVDVLGHVGKVNGVEAKLTAFVNQLQRDWADIQTNTGQDYPRIMFLLPKENLEQLDPQCLEQAQTTLHALSPNVEIVGISELVDAIKTLVGDKFPIAQQDQSPYKGLSAFDPEDRLLFFGREKKVQDTLAKLNEFAAVKSAHRHCIVFGDSGTGKSSFVKAGLLPRLSQQKDSTLLNWAVLKPGDAQGQLLDYLIHCLRPTLDSKGQDQLDALPWRKEPQAAVQVFMSLYSSARTFSYSLSSTESKTVVSAPVFVLVIDQAEELLRMPTANNEMAALKALIQAFSTWHLSPNLPAEQLEPVIWVISTIRLSDYENYKSFLALENEQAHYFACPLTALDPLEDVAAYRAIIENPARLRGIAVDTELTQHLLAAIAELKNPLPTLEYTLHELYLHTVNSHSLAKGLTLQAFKDKAVIGSMSGLITRNAQALLDELKQEAPLRKRIAEFFNLLLGVDKIHGLPYPKPAKIEAFKKPYELNRLYQAFVNHRFLLESDNNVRFCHEVLIREWQAVQNWAAKTALKERNRKVRNLLAGMLFSLALVLVAAYAAYYANQQSEQAKKERDNALIIQSKFLADLSRKHTERGNARLGALLAVEALPDFSKKIEDRRPLVNEAVTSINQAISHIIDRVWFRHTEVVKNAIFSPNGEHIVTVSKNTRIWDANTGQLVTELKGSGHWDNSAAFSPDGSHIVTASKNNTAQIWDANTGQLVTVLEGHNREVNSAEYSPDNYHIVTASKDTMAGIWNAETGQVVAVLKGHTDNIHTAFYSPDGLHIVTASDDDTARIWDSATGQVVAVLKGHTDNIHTAFYSPDGLHIVTASDDDTARIWDSATGQVVAVLKGHTDNIHTAVYSPDGQRIVTASSDKTARIWDAKTGELAVVLEGHWQKVNSAVYSLDGRYIVTAASDDTARVWDAVTGQEVAILEGHTKTVNTAVYSPNSRFIVTASYDGTAHLVTFDIPRKITILKGHTLSVHTSTYSPDGRNVVTTSSFDKTTARIWDAASGRQLFALEGHTGFFNTAVYSPDGRNILTTSGDNTARIWDGKFGQLKAVLEGHSFVVNTANYSPDGKHIVTTSSDKTARIWNAKTGQLELVLKGHTGVVDFAAYSPNGQHIVTASWDKTARIWDAETGKLVAILNGHTDIIRAVAFSPGGRYLVTASDDKTARIWNPETGELVAILNGHTDIIRAVEFSPDGRYLVTASDDKTARIWNPETGELVAILNGHTDIIYAVEFSPDGRYIVTASGDKTARIWDAETGQQVAILEGHSKNVESASFSPDGQHIVTASHDNTARIWDLYETEAIVEKIKHLNLNPLTPEERREYHLD